VIFPGFGRIIGLAPSGAVAFLGVSSPKKCGSRLSAARSGSRRLS
jgi:hypothetical protein